MKKIGIFSILFVGIFCLMFNYAQAETKVFEFYPQEITSGDLLGNIKKDIFNIFLGRSANADTIYPKQGNNAYNFDDHYGFGATDEFFSFTTPAEISWISNTEFGTMNNVDCKKYIQEAKSVEASPANCYEPQGRMESYYPYYVYSATVVTDTILATYPSDPYSQNDRQCLLDVMIGQNCLPSRGADPSYGSSGPTPCWNDSGYVVSTGLNPYFLGSRITTACAHLRLQDNHTQFTQVQWGGHIEIVGKRSSLDNFTIWGNNATTNVLGAAHGGDVLTICKGTNVTINWSTSDGADQVKLFGNNGNIWTPMGVNGPVSDTPQDTTTYYLQYRGYTGDGVWWQIVGPIIVNPIDCNECDQKLSDPNGTNEACIDRYPGEGKNCCNVNVCNACAGGTHHKACNENNVCVSVDGEGDDTCPTINAICGTLSPKTHKACNKNNVCVSVDGEGDDTCPTINDICGTPPPNTHMACNENNVCVSVDGEGDDECTNDTDCIHTGNLTVIARLNGVEVDADVDYSITGPQTINGSQAPKTFNNINADSTNSYIINYISGGPVGSTFINYSPMQSILIIANQTSIVYLDFTDGDGDRCDITVQALCDGSNKWTGPLSYGLLGPGSIILNGMAVDQTFENVPVGRYYLTSLAGGPGIYNGVTPGNPVACPSGGNVNLTMQFKDCGVSSSYKCNTSTGHCDRCDAYSAECEYGDLPACNMQCPGGCDVPHDPKANIFCWANFDSDNCIGVGDNNVNTPSVILSDKSTDSYGDLKVCTWHIVSTSGGIQNIPDAHTCAPYPWYDETPGIYEATLRVTDSCDKSSTAKKDFTIKNVDALTCNFAWDPNAPTVGGATSFFDQTLTPNGTTLKSWSWTFQGASPASSTARTIENVVFNSAGPKSVTLTVKNSANKTCTLTKEITVKTINPYWKEVVPF